MPISIASALNGTIDPESLFPNRPRGLADSAVPPPRPQVFFGRREEINELVSLCISGAGPARLAITGAGGIGKTSLALAFLHEPRIKRRYGKSRLFVSCETALGPENVVASLALKLGHGGTENPLRAVMQTLNSRTIPTLLVLDNLETVWSPMKRDNDAAMERVLAELASVQNLTLIITLRWTVLPGSVSWSNKDTAVLGTLSLEHARRTFIALTQQNMGVLALELAPLHELLREVEYMPLAIKLLARLNDSPAVLLEEWKEVRSGVLQADYHDSTRRELSVEVSIDISLARLGGEDHSYDARQLLALCALLPSGLFPDVLTPLRPSFDRIDQAKEQLERHALVHIGPSMEITMLNPVRHYALSRLTLDAHLRSALKRIYLSVADRFPHDVDADYAAADREIGHQSDNVVAILLSTIMADDVNRKVAHAALRVGGYVLFKSASTVLLDALLLKLREPSLERGRCLHLLAISSVRRFEFDQAHDLLTTAQNLFEQFSFPHGVAACHRWRGDLFMKSRSRVEEAEREYEASGRVWASLGSQDGKAMSYHRLSICAIVLGRPSKAQKLISTAFDIFESTGNSFDAANCLEVQLIIFMTTRRYREALDIGLRMSGEWAKFGDQQSQANCELMIGVLYSKRGEFSNAQKHAECARDLYKECNNTRGLATALVLLAEIACLRGQQMQADLLGTAGISLLTHIGDHETARLCRRIMEKARARSTRQPTRQIRMTVIGLVLVAVGSIAFGPVASPTDDVISIPSEAFQEIPPLIQNVPVLEYIAVTDYRRSYTAWGITVVLIKALHYALRRI